MFDLPSRGPARWLLAVLLGVPLVLVGLWERFRDWALGQ